MKSVTVSHSIRTSLLITFSVAAMVLSAQFLAASSCQQGSASINDPLTKYTIPATYTVVAQSGTSGGCDITAMRLYVDNVGVYTASFGGSQTAGFSYTYTFTQGYHTLVAVAWNNDGYAFTSLKTTIFAAPKDQTVYITEPKPNQTVGSTVTIAARTRWDNADISDMRAYVDNQDVYDASHPLYGAIRFQKTFPSGKHYLVGIAWDDYGNYIKAEEYFTVN